MIDPQKRWLQYGEKPDYLGLLTFAGVPYTEEAAELAGFDVAVVGAPMDDLVSDRPGARLAPRAIRAASAPPGRHLEVWLDALAELRVVDFGDAPVIPADAVRSHAAIEATVGEVLAAAVLPVVLGGDHSITEPSVRACAGVHGPVGVVHFDTHTDTGEEVFGVELSHGTFMRRIIDAGHVKATRCGGAERPGGATERQRRLVRGWVRASWRPDSGWCDPLVAIIPTKGSHPGTNERRGAPHPLLNAVVDVRPVWHL